MHLSITGTRKGLTEAQFDVAKQFIIEDDCIEVLHEGDCAGVDQQVTLMFQDIAPEIWVVCHPAIRVGTRAYGEYDEIREGKGPLIRDQDMVDEGDYLWAFPCSEEIVRSGTWTTVRMARKKGIPITIIMPDGSVIYE